MHYFVISNRYNILISDDLNHKIKFLISETNNQYIANKGVKFI